MEQPHRRSSSFTAPLRESFFDLAQRYHRLREAAFSKPRNAPTLRPPVALTRERRLTDLPPAPSDESVTESVFADRYVDEAPEEETLVQPLARRPSDAPPTSERRQFATMRPPPPPDPLPRILPSTAPLALATIPPPPPPAPHPGLWRPLLVTAAMSAAIGAIVSVGMWAVRTPAAAERATAERPAAALTATPVAANTIGPCPIPTSSLSNSSSSSSSSSNSSSHSSSSGLHEVALEALPVETTSPRAAALSTPVLRAPAPAPTHIAHLDLTEHASKRASEPSRVAPPPVPPAESEKPSKRSRKGAKAEKTEAAPPSDEEATLAAAGSPEPAPTPTAGPDRAAIAKAVGRAAAAASSCESGPQSGRAQITFAPSGNVASVQLLEPFSDNGVNGCVLRALGRAHVPPFAGEPVIVRKALSW